VSVVTTAGDDDRFAWAGQRVRPSVRL